MTTETQTLEELVAQVRAKRAAQVVAPVVKSDWQSAFGSVPDGKLFREAAKLGDEWRKQENERR